ncbi:hypothetical protein CEXT_591651 [Caerostris extrusa]|uniref:ZMIZ1 N-terminal domain-containing protein n=1 Tax=Caerostris extrusa TaxID=172846 RepID=A0AAV4WGR1_CAEEX|nr:hypothetical protein CEXT_591651 [Caerostris extrusa]
MSLEEEPEGAAPMSLPLWMKRSSATYGRRMTGCTASEALATQTSYQTAARELLEWCGDFEAFQKWFEELLLMPYGGNLLFLQSPKIIHIRC